MAFWSARTCPRFESGDVSPHSKSPPQSMLIKFINNYSRSSARAFTNVFRIRTMRDRVTQATCRTRPTGFQPGVLCGQDARSTEQPGWLCNASATAVRTLGINARRRHMFLFAKQGPSFCRDVFRVGTMRRPEIRMIRDRGVFRVKALRRGIQQMKTLRSHARDDFSRRTAPGK